MIDTKQITERLKTMEISSSLEAIDFTQLNLGNEKENMNRISKTHSKELIKEVQNRIVEHSLSESEINDLTFTIIRETGRCFLCGKIEEVSKLREIKLSEEEFKKVEDNKSIRSCLIISNDTQNEFDERIVVVGTTTKGLEKIEPFEVFIENTKENGLDKPSKVLLNYPRTIRKSRLKESTFLGVADPEIMEKVKLA
ncbi:hypothetical protein C1645_839256 [Glomus cerebriforme]|uniref:Uncharacterized protein n=1 Tax=Glomus cerebriforme TaxID=658196 RepID=A0A397S5V3_9GLOM|nr:hypothetical protein C1645_839256 [Glomus cerebriforme]